MSHSRAIFTGGVLLALAASLGLGCRELLTRGAPRSPARVVASVEGEGHLVNVRQLTFEGENAEAYFSGDGSQLVFQSTHGELKCDQIFVMNLDGTGRRRVSTGKGRTTCSYFAPDGSRIVYASTHLGSPDCPPPPPPPPPYVWRVYEDFDIFSESAEGGDLRRLTDARGYDAEPTYSRDGSRIVFTSARTGDLEIWDMKPDGSDQRQLTDLPGYDGGPFFSPDGKTICFRASRPRGKDLEKYRTLLAKGQVEPSRLEIYVMDANGANIRQVTSNGRANFCPFFHPSGRQLIFATNQHSTDRRKPNFDLFLVDIDSGEEERVTYSADFDGFPMFSPDGTKLVWASNRFNERPGETNVFIADWKD